MNVFLQEGRKLWLRDTDSGTRNSNSYKQQLALGFNTIFIESKTKIFKFRLRNPFYKISY